MAGGAYQKQARPWPVSRSDFMRREGFVRGRRVGVGKRMSVIERGSSGNESQEVEVRRVASLASPPFDPCASDS